MAQSAVDAGIHIRPGLRHLSVAGVRIGGRPQPALGQWQHHHHNHNRAAKLRLSFGLAGGLWRKHFWFFSADIGVDFSAVFYFMGVGGE